MTIASFKRSCVVIDATDNPEITMEIVSETTVTMQRLETTPIYVITKIQLQPQHKYKQIPNGCP